MSSPKYEGGLNIAMKIPKSKYEQTVSFYRDTLGFEVVEEKIEHLTISRSFKLQFGPNILWLDCVDNYTHSEAWFELKTNDVEKAKDHLQSKGIKTCDEIEQIPEDHHWIQDPAGNVFILTK